MATATELVGKVVDKLTPSAETTDTKPPKDVEERIKRGRDRLKQLVAPRRECIEFTNNNHYAYLSADGSTLKQQSTVTEANGRGKPSHRVRLSRDLIGPVVKGKISATTQRVPGYDSVATSTDSEDYSAANLAEKIAVGGYDLWRLKRANKKLVWSALVTEEGFIRAFWDNSVGPFVDVSKHPLAEQDMGVDEEGNPIPNPYEDEPDPENPEYIGMGEVGVQTYSGLEVGWEPGVDFEDSRWIFIDHARPTDDVEKEPGFFGEKLKADADTSDTIGKERKGSNLVIVTEFLERPCPDYPEGRRLFMANGRVILPVEPYPLQDKDGNTVDEPCIHRLAYDIDGSSDRDKGLVRSLIESVREYDHAGNKMLEWMQLMLNPQWNVPEGSMLTPFTDEPGAKNEYSILPGQNKPEPVIPPQIPQEFAQIQDRAQALIGTIAHDNDVPSQVESAKGIQTLVTKDALAWQDFIEDFADLQARLMRDCLTLVQLHYSEDRLVKFRGRTGWESIADFKGADIRGQTDIRVDPSSLEPRTRASTEQRIRDINQMFPGYFPPEVVIAALEGGSAEKLIEGYEDHVSRANRIISQIRSGQFWSQPMRPTFPNENIPEVDPETGEVIWAVPPSEPELGPEGMPVGGNPGQPVMATEVPGWMPRPFDNVAIHKTIFENWMTTDDWEHLDEASQRATMAYYGALLELEEKKAMRQAQLQTESAEKQGMSNAAKPQATKPGPSLPAAPE
jgi:hypothetical protein